MNKKLVKDLLEIAKDLDSEQENFFESGNENLNKLWEIIERLREVEREIWYNTKGER